MNSENQQIKVEVLINDLLAERNLFLRELARLSGIKPSNLSNLPNGKRKKIYLEHIEKIAEALDIDAISRIIRLNKKETK
ncbi:helix-turn-helix domain-containing protein [Listeria welshimeri]|uniref:helix-turn-helix domain-containing protein n=1 Tax=Listeria welshimeri TaxID=1643 RepID=UPI001625E233|nr:helix-turn-helix transcriptional regulator [Listeria welshimeri]MBC1643173.1 helix-turn-helix transcriptional regulator [Listeria welshimeri]MBC1657413.1 helix-turn-helix transcriptional regulator [Listeria welshimeri]MBC1861983.1 helix-turn-helix transcriptional regulator [Listeria welshimeri]MBC1957309.1 helix-turn-helix transcriptional regulator [Listeria welshimeri]MBC2344170.1 helix-turn-helix transcriptional regulator [Listeria welshimeri]